MECAALTSPIECLGVTTTRGEDQQYRRCGLDLAHGKYQRVASDAAK
jgi:hypothetical protein